MEFNRAIVKWSWLVPVTLSAAALLLYIFHPIGQWGLLILPFVYICIWAFRRFSFPSLYAALVLLLPLSVPISLSSSIQLVFPSEPLVVVFGVLLFIQLIRSNSWQWILREPIPLMWLASFIIPIFYSEHPAVSLKFTTINALYVGVFYYGTLWWKQSGQIDGFQWKAFSAGLLPVLVVAFFTFYQYDFNPVTLRGIYEPFFYSHTIFGASIALLAGYAVAHISKSRYWLLLAVILGMITVFSGSRAALWSYVLALLTGGLLQLKPLARAVVPVFAIGALVLIVGPSRIIQTVENNPYLSHNPRASILEKSLSVTNVQTDVSNLERINRWVAAWEMGRERWSTGFGPGTYQFTYIPYQEEAFMNRLTVRNPERPPEGSGGTAHSEILLQWAENGLLTALLFIGMILRWLYLGFFRIQRPSVLHQAYFLGLFTYLIHMHFNNFLNQPVFAFLFWTFAALFDAELRRESLEPATVQLKSEA